MSYQNNDNIAGERSRRRCNCDFVFECLLELLEDALEENNHCHRNNWSRDNVAGDRNRRRRDCRCVFKCLEELLEDALEDHHHCCPR